jgi:ligand-binding sensor domain-containing protein
VTAIALDAGGHLWIGYPNGLQIGSKTGFRSIQDQQFLKNLNIGCIARWGDDMWVAAGRAGLHRYHDGAWTWYKPLGPEGLGCYTVVSMAVDAASDALVVGSERDGLRVLRNRTGEVRFEPVTCDDEPVRGISEVRVDPFGGVYLFNRTTVLHYDPGGKVTPILDTGDLNPFPVAINDLAATSGGMLLIATDDGIYGWNSSGVALHIASGDGIRSNVVKKLFIDADGRCWFVVPGNVGYIPPTAGHATLDLAAAPVLAPHEPETPAIETPTADIPSVEPAGVPDMLSGAWASFVEWVNARLAGA